MPISEGSTPLALPGGNPAKERDGPLIRQQDDPRPRRFKKKPVPALHRLPAFITGKKAFGDDGE